MTTPPQHHSPDSRGMAALLPVAAAILVVAAVLLHARGQRLGFAADEAALRLALALLTIEVTLVAVLAPCLARRALLSHAWARRLRVVAVPFAILGVTTALACALATGDWATTAAACWAQVFLLAFVVFIVAVVALLKQLGASPTCAQWLATVLALAMVSSTFTVNGAIEALSATSAKLLVARVVLWTNPWLIVGGSVLLADPLRAQQLYEWCVIGDYQFAVSYPATSSGSLAARTLVVSGAYLAAAVLVAGLTRLVRRRSASPG